AAAGGVGPGAAARRAPRLGGPPAGRLGAGVAQTLRPDGRPRGAGPALLGASAVRSGRAGTGRRGRPGRTGPRPASPAPTRILSATWVGALSPARARVPGSVRR